jgi:hypothetical protein
MVDQQTGGDEPVEHLGERVLAHPNPSADLKAPPWCFGMPAGHAVRRVGAYAAVLHPFDVWPVEARMGTVERKSPPGARTRAASAATDGKSSTSVEIHDATTVRNVPSPNGSAAPSPLTTRRDRRAAKRNWSAE